MTEVHVVTREEALADVEWLVNETGEDFQFTSICEYADWKDGHLIPKCGIGRILHHRGVSSDVLKAMDEAYVDPDHPRRTYSEDSTTTIDAEGVLRILWDRAGIELSPGALGVYWEFQGHQDNEIPYGECASRASIAGDGQIRIDIPIGEQF